MSDTILRVAHLSDLHVFDLGGVRWTRFLNKRLTGAISLLSGRAESHPVELAEKLVADVARQAVDHVVVTGDLTNLALESELERAAAVLAPLGGADTLSVIPGNHDIYTRGAARARRFERYFGGLMWPDVADPTDRASARYPWYKRLAPDVDLVGLCSAVPRLPLIATGHIDGGQLARLREMARAGDFAHTFAIGLLHHNLHVRGPRRDTMHGLDNRDEFMAAATGARLDLVLHGHTHVAHSFERDGVRIIGSGSSTWSSRRPDHAARYNVYHIANRRLVRVETRIWDARTDEFGPAESPR